jgi:glycosyltransferase involved in cell wall biosynthesis
LSRYIQSEKFHFWRDIDFLIVPSRFDNSPNVIHEAKSLGIPVIGAKVGGIVELLDPVTDFLIDIPEMNAQFLVEKKEILINILFNKNNVLKSQSRFKNWSKQSTLKHIELYENILNS